MESYIKIDFQFETGTSTIFAYEDSGKYYIEQPYQGIYKIDSQLFERFIRNWLIQVYRTESKELEGALFPFL